MVVSIRFHYSCPFLIFYVHGRNVKYVDCSRCEVQNPNTNASVWLIVLRIYEWREITLIMFKQQFALFSSARKWEYQITWKKQWKHLSSSTYHFQHRRWTLNNFFQVFNRFLNRMRAFGKLIPRQYSTNIYIHLS